MVGLETQISRAFCEALDVVVSPSNSSQFSVPLCSAGCRVYRRSREKLLKISLGFFSNLPSSPFFGKNAQTPESKKEEFRKYLEKSGVIDALTKVLVGLYEEPERPPNAVDYIKR